MVDLTYFRDMKLLYTLGDEKCNIKFTYPRAITTDSQGNIYIVDSFKDKIYQFNKYCIFIKAFGSSGSGQGQLINPTDISKFPNDYLIIADNGNKRLQVYSPRGHFTGIFPTRSKPLHVMCDSKFNVAVATVDFVVEVYDKDQRFVSEFQYNKPFTTAMPPVGRPAVLLHDGKIVICDPSSNQVRVFNLGGEFQHEFVLQSGDEGLAMESKGVLIDCKGRLVIIDSLNHTVNMYNFSGDLLDRALYPPDQLGAAQSCTITPEGHLGIVEFSLSAPHTVKIFRYEQCTCHVVDKGRVRNKQSAKNSSRGSKTPQRSSCLRLPEKHRISPPESAIDLTLRHP